MNRKHLFFLAALCLILHLNAQEADRKKDLNEAERRFADNKPDEAIALCKQIIAADPSLWGAYGLLRQAYGQLKQLDQAQAYFEELLVADPNNPSIYFGLGEVYWHKDKQDYLQAIAHYKRSIELKATFAYVYWALGNAYATIRQPEGAIAFFQDQLKSDPENGYLHYGLGLAWQSLDAQKALYHLDAAIAHRPDLLDAYSAKGSVVRGLREYEKSLQIFTSLLERAEKSHDVEHEWRTLNKIGNTYFEQRDYELALAYYRKALVILQRIGNRAWEASVLNNMSEAYQVQGNYGQALECSLKSLEITRQLKDRTLEAYTLSNIAPIYFVQGNVEKALASLQVVLTIWPKSLFTADTLRKIGDIYHSQSQYEQALTYYRKGLAATASSLSKRLDEGRLHNEMGAVYRRQGRYQRALAEHRKSLAIGREIGDRLVQVGAWVGLGNAYYDQGDYAHASEHFREALAVGKAIHTWTAVWESHWGLARALEKQGPSHWPDALAHYRSAAETIKTLRSQWQQPEDRMRFLQDKTVVYEHLCNLLARLHRQAAGAGKSYDRAAFQYAEEAKARALIELLEESRASIHLTAGLEAGWAKKERALQVGLADVQRQLEKEEQAARIQALEKRRDDLYHDYENLIGELRRRHPRYAELKYPEPVTVEQCQAGLDGETVLLEYLLGEKSSLLFAISRDGYAVFKLPGRRTLEGKVKTLKQTFTAEGMADPRVQLAYVEQAGTLYDQLIKPAESMLRGKKRILVVPDGALNYLPFAALLTSEVAIAGQVDFKRLPYLAKRYAISYAPSASVWRELIKAQKDRPSPQKRFLAFADPAYEMKSVAAGPVAHLRDGEDSALRGAYDERGQHWRRLPRSGEEVRRIAELYPKEDVGLFLREEATEENVKQAPLWEYQRIHFAAHSIANETRPQFSGIILTTQAGSGEDGYLQMYEIFNLRLKARLVVLSGCNTGLGKATNGEGMVGLTRAFLYAGAERVLASLWKIEDRSTSEFMKAFYAGLEKNTTAQALRAAQLVLINGGHYSHPYYWGAFALYGGH